MASKNRNQKFFNTSAHVKKALGEFEALTHLEKETTQSTSIDLKMMAHLKKLLKELSK